MSDVKLQALLLRAEAKKMELAYAQQHYGASHCRMLLVDLNCIATQIDDLAVGRVGQEPSPAASESKEPAPTESPASLAPSAEALPPLPEADDVAYLKTRVEEYERELREFLASSDTDYLIACCTSMLANRDAVIRYIESARAAEAPRLTDEQIDKLAAESRFWWQGLSGQTRFHWKTFARAIESAIRPSADAGAAGVPQGWQLPKEPPPGLLMSMALRYDHGLGLPGYYDGIANMWPAEARVTHAQRLASTLSTMRQLYEEVSGHGFYSPDKEAEYAMLSTSPTAPALQKQQDDQAQAADSEGGDVA